MTKAMLKLCRGRISERLKLQRILLLYRGLRLREISVRDKHGICNCEDYTSRGQADVDIERNLYLAAITRDLRSKRYCKYS